MSRRAGMPVFATLSVKCTSSVLSVCGETGVPPVASLGAEWCSSTPAAPGNYQGVSLTYLVRKDARGTAAATTAAPPVGE